MHQDHSEVVCLNNQRGSSDRKRGLRRGGTKRMTKVQVGLSDVHGIGVYAATGISKGERIIEYKGRHISWKKAVRDPPHDPKNPNHTFYFNLEDGDVIDPLVRGNEARWINHSCDPNCEAIEEKGRVFIYALHDLAPGEELFYDYKLQVEGRRTQKLKNDFECRCRSANCRGTMLEPK